MRLLPKQASKLPPAVDRAWEAVGGGPPDLFFPEEFLGVWQVDSTLTSVKLPLGPDFVPDPKVRSLSEGPARIGDAVFRVDVSLRLC